MSRVYLLAADKPLPAYTSENFQTAPLEYYRQAVDELGYPMKPYRCELSLEKNERSVRNLRVCLEEHCSHGDCVELWSVWVGDVDRKCPPRFQGELEDFDLETLEQFLDAKEICITVRIP